MSKTIEQQWQDFRGALLAKSIDAETISKLRHVFYNGFVCAYTTIVDGAELSADEAAACLENIGKQLDEYHGELQREVMANQRRN